MNHKRTNPVETKIPFYHWSFIDFQFECLCSSVLLFSFFYWSLMDENICIETNLYCLHRALLLLLSNGEACIRSKCINAKRSFNVILFHAKTSQQSREQSSVLRERETKGIRDYRFWMRAMNTLFNHKLPASKKFS